MKQKEHDIEQGIDHEGMCCVDYDKVYCFSLHLSSLNLAVLFMTLQRFREPESEE